MLKGKAMIKELEVPQSLKDCSPDQLAKWAYLVGDGVDLETLAGKLDFRAQVVSIFSGVSRKKIESQTDIGLINQTFSHLITILSEPTPPEPTGRVVINNEVFIFDKDFKRKQTGQVIDLKLIGNVWEDPCEALSILYVEEGRYYNEIDEYENILNPSAKRYKIFKEEFPGDEFLSVFAFFLSSWEKRKDAIWALNIARTKVQMEKMTKEMKTEIQAMKTGTTGQQT